MAGASKPVDVSTKRQRIAELARQSPEMGFTSLAYFIDIDWLLQAYRQTRKDGATGVDGQDGEDYAVNLMGNLQALLDRAKSGTYVAPPVRRVHIPKAGSATETRPLGIPTFEDKVLQRAVVMVLEPIYEQDFLDCSYGFRPGRSAHQALDALWQQTMAMGGGWIVDVDIRKFFDTIDHGHLREFLKRRVRDGVLLCQKLIGHFAYYGITGNSVALSLFRRAAIHIWRRWLSRQRRDGTIPWSEFTRFLKRYPLPPPIAIHSVCRPVARS